MILTRQKSKSNQLHRLLFVGHRSFNLAFLLLSILYILRFYIKKVELSIFYQIMIIIININYINIYQILITYLKTNKLKKMSF